VPECGELAVDAARLQPIGAAPCRPRSDPRSRPARDLRRRRPGGCARSVPRDRASAADSLVDLSGSCQTEPNDPEGVAVDWNGNVFVADDAKDRIEKFDNNGTFLTAWGSTGTGNGQFHFPADVAVYSRYVFVADRGNSRIQKFDNNGTFLTAWGGGVMNTMFPSAPIRLAVDGTGNVFVSDNFNNLIQKFDNNGTFLTAWGSQGTGNGQFSGTAGVACDGYGNVFVFDEGDARVEKFACPILPPPSCGVVSGDPATGTATCGGPCPSDFPFCAWVPGTVTGSCRCVDNPCPVGVVGAVCSGNLCSSQSQTCTTTGLGCVCQ
jgi:hypothetical protein